MSMAAKTGMGARKKALSIFPALASRNYQLYFGGQFISLTGTWLQTVAQGWLVFELTRSAFLIGVVTALSSLPTLMFTLFGGVIVDVLPTRKILLFTQTASMALAFILGMLTAARVVTVTEIAVLAFLLGVVNAIDSPARQSFVAEMVDKDSLGSAIALNSAIFNAARVIGPSIAGILIVYVGTGGAFLINSASYIAVIAALLLMRVQAPAKPVRHHPLRAIKEGISVSFTNPVIRTLLLLTAVTSIFGWSYTTILPVIADNIFHAGPSGLGHLYAAAGLGALTATIIVSAASSRVGPLWFILGGNTLFTCALLLFTFTQSLYAAMGLLYLCGVGLLMQFSTMNTTIQKQVADNVRGRVMSIYILMFIGLSPIGNFEVGYLAEALGPRTAIRAGAVTVFIFGLLIFLRRKKLSEAHRAYTGTSSEPGA